MNWGANMNSNCTPTEPSPRCERSFWGMVCTKWSTRGPHGPRMVHEESSWSLMSPIGPSPIRALALEMTAGDSEFSAVLVCLSCLIQCAWVALYNVLVCLCLYWQRSWRKARTPGNGWGHICDMQLSSRRSHFVNRPGLVERCLCLFVCDCQRNWLGRCLSFCLFVCVCQHPWLAREMGTSSIHCCDRAVISRDWSKLTELSATGTDGGGEKG